jgi:hypothetical protein
MVHIFNVNLLFCEILGLDRIATVWSISNFEMSFERQYLISRITEICLLFTMKNKEKSTSSPNMYTFVFEKRITTRIFVKLFQKPSRSLAYFQWPVTDHLAQMSKNRTENCQTGMSNLKSYSKRKVPKKGPYFKILEFGYTLSQFEIWVSRDLTP